MEIKQRAWDMGYTQWMCGSQSFLIPSDNLRELTVTYNNKSIKSSELPKQQIHM
jgi:hypothetical protein